MNRVSLSFILVVLVILLLSFHPSSSQESEAIKKVDVKIPGGETIALYKGSYALVVGNGNYTKGWDPLPGALKDVDEVARVLEEVHHFKVVKKKDLTRNEFLQVLTQFIHEYGKQTDSRVLFYYAGHGHTEKLENGEDLGYIVMVDAPSPGQDPIGLNLCSLDMQWLNSESRKIRAKHVLFVFDSCFSGTILNVRSSLDLKKISDLIKLPVCQFITAGRAHESVSDRSIFKRVLLDLLEGRDPEPFPDGYITGEELGYYLKSKVPSYQPTQHPQFGTVNDPERNKGDFVFVAPRIAPPGHDKTKTGGIHIETEPAGAALWINGQEKGTAPLEILDLAEGARVNVRASAKGFRDEEKSVLIREGKVMPLRLILKRTAGLLSVTSDPPGAEWYLDGALAGRTPDVMESVPAKEYSVKIRLEGFPDWEDKVLVTEGKKAEIVAKLVSPNTTRHVIPTPPTTSIKPPDPNDAHDANSIAALLSKAEVAFARKEFLSPEETSAMSYYRQVFELDEGNEAAYEGVLRVIDQYLKWAAAAPYGGGSSVQTHLKKARECLQQIPEGLTKQHNQEIAILKADIDKRIARPAAPKRKRESGNSNVISETKPDPAIIREPIPAARKTN